MNDCYILLGFELLSLDVNIKIFWNRGNIDDKMRS